MANTDLEIRGAPSAPRADAAPPPVDLRTRDRADFDFLLANARAGLAIDLPSFLHLDQPIGLWSYIRIANDILERVSPGRLLDWGCGYGQMTYLLARRGFGVTPMDVAAAGTKLPDVPLTRAIPQLILTSEPRSLPFENASFDAVLSCGVLEHVEEHGSAGSEKASLGEIRRVLRPGGALLIYQLPQQHAWQEAAMRRFKLGYAHPRRYTADEITRMLAEAGFRVRHLARANLVPKNLTGMPEGLRRLYNRFSRPLLTLDGWLSNAPLIDHVAGVLEIHAERIV
jgi:SAM-dependent methyltransferase